MIRKAVREDVPVIMRLVEEARGIMRSCGNVNQWIDLLLSRGQSRLIRKSTRVIGSMTSLIM